MIHQWSLVCVETFVLRSRSVQEFGCFQCSSWLWSRRGKSYFNFRVEDFQLAKPLISPLLWRTALPSSLLHPKVGYFPYAPLQVFARVQPALPAAHPAHFDYSGSNFYLAAKPYSKAMFQSYIDFIDLDKFLSNQVIYSNRSVWTFSAYYSAEPASSRISDVFPNSVIPISFGLQCGPKSQYFNHQLLSIAACAH